MTLPTERMRAVNSAREFLASLLRAPRIPQAIRDQAGSVLKHFPTGYDMAVQARRDQDVFQEEPDGQTWADTKPPADFKQELREQARRLLQVQEANRVTRSAALAVNAHALAIRREIQNTSIGK